jgi:hypothetical protein
MSNSDSEFKITDLISQFSENEALNIDSMQDFIGAQNPRPQSTFGGCGLFNTLSKLFEKK